MSGIKNISIPQPCQKAEWENMTQTASGRHCVNCDKTVVDFSGMDKQQIINVLSRVTKSCGRFSNEQVNLINSSLNDSKPESSLWKRLAVAAAVLLCSVPFFKTEAKTNSTYQMPKNRPDKMPVFDTVKMVTVTGRVTDTTNDGLKGSLIRTHDLKYQTTANSLGEFKLTIPDTVKVLQVSSIGFWTVDININSKPDHQYKIMMKVEPFTMGEIIIKRN